MTISAEQAMQNLREMFPNHPVEVLEQAIRDNNGLLDSAINQLLSTPTHKSKGSKKHIHGQDKAPRAQQGHIFPPDFLAWPSDIEWELVETDTGPCGASLLQTEDDCNLVTAGMTQEMMGEVPHHTISKTNYRQNQDIWSKMKTNFLTMTSEYNKI